MAVRGNIGEAGPALTPAPLVPAADGSAASSARPATESVLDACFEAAAVGLMIVAPDGVILRANGAFAAMLGTTPAEVVGRSVVELTHPDERALSAAVLRSFSSGDRSPRRVEKRYRRADGSDVWAEITVVPAFGPDGRPSHQLATVRDLTERRALADRLHAASTRLQVLFDADVLGVAVANAGGVLEANDEFLRIVGIPRARFDAQGFDWQASTPPEDLAKDRAAMRELLARGACAAFEKEFVRPDGSRVSVLVGAALIEREPLTWIAFAIDLTERRRVEQERDQLLEEARAAREVAERALAARDVLLARVTHDLRTPIGANMGYASILLEGIPAPLHPVHAGLVERMRRNQKHMLALLDDLLVFARGGASREPLALATVPVDALLAEVEPLIGPQARAAGVAYSCGAVDPALVVRADRVKALQVLANLVGNALKFTPAGGRVTLAATADADRVLVTVTDTGVGIPAAQLDRIFEPFVRLDAPGGPPPSNGQRGFGLGLAISRDLARGMGGELTVESAPGRGSAFCLTLRRA